MVEMRGVEPLSENIAIWLSPSAGVILLFASVPPDGGLPGCYPKRFPLKAQGKAIKVSCCWRPEHFRRKETQGRSIKLLKRNRF